MCMRLKWQIFRKNYRVGKSLATEWRVFIVDKLFASVSIFIVYWKDCGDCRHFKQGIVSRKIYWKNRFASLKGSIAPLKEHFWIRYWSRVFVQSCGHSMARTSSFQRSSLFFAHMRKKYRGSTRFRPNATKKTRSQLWGIHKSHVYGYNSI